jgi:site-specific DNA-methyltransferase (adenine-specific)
MGTLYYGDNLVTLREHVADESVDLVYLDPPFNSDATYNLLFRSPSGEPSGAQAAAFVDTWRWGEEASFSFGEVMGAGGAVAGILSCLKKSLGETDVTAYLAMMTARLIELRKKLKPAGSLYLHCDPTASHYLKIILDAVFGPEGFRSEVIWKRTSAHSGAKRYGPVHDVLLYYARSGTHVWNPQFQDYDPQYVEAFYTHRDPEGRRWRRSDLTGAGVRNGETGKPWRGIDVTAKGRHWSCAPQDLDRMDAEGRIHWPRKAGGMPMLKRYLDDQPGTPLQDVWTDIPPMHNLAAERLGYPTQKPLKLMERIIQASSNPGDVVLDPFCGCGTTVHAAEALGRKWIGIDVTHYAVSLIENRIADAFPDAKVEVIGRPRDMEAARHLAARNRHQFQWWATWLLGAHANEERGERGIDGLYFFKNGPFGEGIIVANVKSAAAVGPDAVRELLGAMELREATLGVLVSLNRPSARAYETAAATGLVTTAHGKHPKVRIVLIEDLLAGHDPGLPPPHVIHSRRELLRGTAPLRKLAKASPQLSFTFPIEGGKTGHRNQSDLLDWRSGGSAVVAGE